jgi:hypothetical protein
MSASAAWVVKNARTRGTHRGVDWYTAPAPMDGAVNGYMRIPADHPLARTDYSSINKAMWDGEEQPKFDGGSGELTFASDMEDGSTIVGFDTLHYQDSWPGGMFPPDEGSTRWTPELVEKNCRRWCWWLATKAVAR